MSRVGICGFCKHPALIGSISSGEEICSRCASIKFNAPESVVTLELIKHSGLDLKDIIAQIEELIYLNEKPKVS